MEPPGGGLWLSRCLTPEVGPYASCFQGVLSDSPAPEEVVLLISNCRDREGQLRERCRTCPGFPGGPGMCPVAEWGFQVMVWPVRNIVTGWPCTVSSGASGPAHQGLPSQASQALVAFRMLEVDGPSSSQPLCLCRLERSLLADGQASHAASIECPAVSGIAEPSTSPPGRLRPPGRP